MLLVEDDPTVTAIVRTTLEQAGYDVREAGDGGSAQFQIATRFPDVLVVDLGLPDGNGLDLVKSLRTQAVGDLFIVVLSGFRQERNVLAAFEAGADDFVTKPFSPRELVARIKRQSPA